MSGDAAASVRPPLWRRALAEAVGTGMLVAVVVGSGIAAERLSTDAGLQLLENTVATALGLGVLIVLLGPVSGAHFNPAVSLVDATLGRRSRTGLTVRATGAYLAAQMAGAVAGAVLANLMFAVPTTLSTTARATPATFLAEGVATGGLVLMVVGLSRSGRGVPVVGVAVGAYIGAAYWFTSSTAFANPAVTVGRVFTDTFAGIEPGSAALFICAQLLGAVAGAALAAALFPAGRASHSQVRDTPRGIVVASDPVLKEDPTMCYAVDCPTCGKTTWDGCGQHVDAVRRTVPDANWCEGHEQEAAASGGLFGKLFGGAR